MKTTIQSGAMYGSTLAADLPEGDAGTDATVAAMTAVIHHAGESPHVGRVVSRLLPGLMQNKAVPVLVFGWLKKHCRFKRDPWGKELLRHPDQLITEIESTGQALCDCDDVAMLAASLCMACGARPVLIVMGRDRSGPFEHVYAGVKIDRAVPPYGAIDPQECDAPGRERPAARRKVYSV